MTGEGKLRAQVPDRTPEPGGIEQRVDRWASMLDDAVRLLNQVMTEVKETGHTDDDNARGH